MPLCRAGPAANQPLPQGYDLVWSRDSLQHLPLHATWQFLNNVRASGAKYLLVGTYLEVGVVMVGWGGAFRQRERRGKRAAPRSPASHHSPMPPNMQHADNKDINAGAYYPISLREPPFDLHPEPLLIIDEDSQEHEVNTLVRVARANAGAGRATLHLSPCYGFAGREAYIDLIMFAPCHTGP